jgi:hypothetical protein
VTKLLYIIRGQEDITVGISFEKRYDDGRKPSLFKEKVQETLRKHTDANNKHTAKGTYFFDYGNAFFGSFPRERILWQKMIFRYPSYVQDIMGPMCFDWIWAFPLGLCFRKTRRFTKTEYWPAGTGRNGKTALLKFKCRITFSG